MVETDWRLVLVTMAYVLVFAGMWFTISPWRFRDLILARGHAEDYGTMFRAFYGKDPEIGPMLEDRGLVKAGN